MSRLLNSDNLKIAEYLDSGFSYVTAILEYALLSVRYRCHRWLCDPPVTWEPPPPPKLKCKISGSNKPLSLFLTTQKLLLYSHLSLKLFLTSNRVEVTVVERSRKSAYDLVKIKNQSHKCSGIGVRRIRTFPFLPTPLPTLSLTFRLWSSENQIVGVGSRSRRINQPQCMFPCFVIGLVPLLLLPTPTIW